MTLFLLVPGVNGGSADADHVGWFEIDSYDLDLTSLITGGAGGSSSGTVEFSPLVLNLALTSGLVPILQRAAGGQFLSGIKIEGWTEGGESEKAFELTLADVTLKNVHEETGTGDSLVLNFKKIGLTTYEQSSSGGPPVVQTFGYDLNTRTAIAPPTVTQPPGTENSGSGGTKFFLLIPGLNGGSTDQNHVGWFEIDSYALDLATLTSGGTGGGGASTTAFSPLTVALALNSGLAEILAIAAQGQRLSGIKIEGWTQGAEPTRTLELTLADVTLKNVHEETGTGDSLVFDYGKIGLTTYGQTETGLSAPPQTFGYDVETRQSIAPPIVNLPPGAEPSGGSTGTKLFLLIPGIDGGSEDASHAGWFEIDSYNLDVLGALSGDGGLGTSPAQFSLLAVKLALDSGLTEILRTTALGQILTGIRIEGMTSGAQPQKTFELTLADVTLRAVHEENGSGDSLVFDYDQIGLTTYAQSNTGGPTVVQTFGYDLDTREIIDPPIVGSTNLLISPIELTHNEGAVGVSSFEFTVTRTGDLSGASTVSWTVSGSDSNPATAADFEGSVIPAGTLNFAIGEASKTISVSVVGDGLTEADETFRVTLSNGTGSTIAVGIATATILNDDFPTVQGTPGNETLNGTSGNDVYDPLGGVDILRDRGGNDAYLISDGRLDRKAIIEASGSGGGTQDLLWLTGALSGNVIALGRDLPRNIEQLRIDPALDPIVLRDLAGLANTWTFDFTMEATSFDRLGTIDAGGGNDLISLLLKILTPDQVSLQDPLQVSAGSGNDTVNVALTGSTGLAGGEPHRVAGDAGNDIITIALNGFSWVAEGGSGNDTIQINAGPVSSASTGVLVASAPLSPGSGGEVHGGGGADGITGSTLNDRLFGEADADQIRAGDGNDLVDLGAGLDTAAGGNGTDVFVLSQGRDTILDYKDGLDKIGLVGGLTFGDLTIKDNRGGAIIIAAGFEMQLVGIRPDQIAGSDFWTV